MTRQLLNTLFVQTQGAYLRLKNETVCVEAEGVQLLRVPLHHLGGMVLFGNVLISPFLLHRCAEDRRQIAWYSANGRFQARLHGPVSGNVLLRSVQHEFAADTNRSLKVATGFVSGKLRNSRQVLLRALRESKRPMKRTEAAVKTMEAALDALNETDDMEILRGIEGQAAAVYFRAFPELIRIHEFSFESRTRRPPRDPVNAILSFIYSLVRTECESALEGVGLDPQIGFLHVLRPGRPALALDLMEEFRSWWADRLALSLINRRQLRHSDFNEQPGGAVLLTDDARRTLLAAYQQRKQEEVRHPLFQESVPIGLLPYIQARLLARYLRGGLDRYVSFTPR